jgi:hypothetical protein
MAMVLLALIALVNIISSFFSEDWGSVLIAFLPMVVILSVFALFYYGPFTRIRLSREPRFFIEQNWRFTEEGVHHQTEHGESQNAWSAYVQASENSQFFFLFLGKNMIAPIPKRAFVSTEEQAQFRELLKRKVGFKPN